MGKTWKAIADEFLRLGDEIAAQFGRLEGEVLALRWQQADLLVGLAPDAMAQVAGHVGRSKGTLMDWASTAKAFGPAGRKAPLLWTTFVELRSKPGLLARAVEEKWGPDRARAEADPTRRPKHPSLSDRPIKDRTDAAQVLLEDPEVVASLAATPTGRSAVTRAAAMASKSIEPAVDPAQKHDQSAFYAASGDLLYARRLLARALDSMRQMDLDDDRRQALREALEQVEIVVDWSRSFLDSGSRSFESELESILQEA